MRRLLLATVALSLLACRSAQTAGTARAAAAHAAMRNAANESVGDLRLDRTDDGVRVTGELFNLTPGSHGIHFHAVGRCDDATFESAGAHFNPAERQHGLDNPSGPHAGDLPNITVPAGGRVAVDITSPRVSLDSAATTLLDADGSAILIHAAADDQRTDPAGDSGARVACGVVMRG